MRPMDENYDIMYWQHKELMPRRWIEEAKERFNKVDVKGYEDVNLQGKIGYFNKYVEVPKTKATTSFDSIYYPGVMSGIHHRLQTGQTEVALATFVAYPGLLGRREQTQEKYIDGEGEYYIYKRDGQEYVSSRPRGNTNNSYEHKRFPFDPIKMTNQIVDFDGVKLLVSP